MYATEEWLRYIESKALMQRYDIKGYEEDSEEKDEDFNEKSTKESESI